MNRLAATLALVFLLAAPAAAAGAASETVVVLPLVNLSGVDGAEREVGAVVTQALAARGYRAEAGAAIEEFLRNERIRYLDSLSDSARRKLLSQFSASAVLLGTVFRFVGDPDPSVSVLLRLADADGRTVWERLFTLSASDTEGVFGLGRLSSLDAVLGQVGRKAARSLPPPGSGAPVVSSRGRPFLRSAPRTYRSSALSARSRVVVLPFRNLSSEPDAGRLAVELAAYRLRASDRFEVVDPAEMRAAMVAGRVRTALDPDPAELRRLAEALGTTLFLTGTVNVFRDPAGTVAGVGPDPEVEVNLALVEAGRGRIVWTSLGARKGSDYQGLLELGGISNAVALLDQVLAEMVRAYGTAPAKAPRPS